MVAPAASVSFTGTSAVVSIVGNDRPSNTISLSAMSGDPATISAVDPLPETTAEGCTVVIVGVTSVPAKSFPRLLSD